MLRIAICDDEGHARDSLRLMLERLLHNGDGEVVYEFSGGKSAVSWITKHRGELDLLFLDIEMKELSGMEAARLIRRHDNDLLLVFVTGYADYVFVGYSVQALDYLIKPVKEEKLRQVLDRAKLVLEKKAPQIFQFQNSEGIYRINKGDILYFQSEKRVLRLITQDKEYTFYAKLDEVEQELASGFIRIHQRYLVRNAAIIKLEKNTITIGNTSLPVSRSLQKGVLKALAHSILEVTSNP